MTERITPRQRAAWQVAVRLALPAAITCSLAAACAITGTGSTPDAGADSGSTADGGTASDAGDTGAADGAAPGDGSGGETATEGGGSGHDGGCALPDGGTGTTCSIGCVDLQADPAHCGGCAATCEAGALCSSAQCQDIAGALNGLRWELPCTNGGGICATVPAVTLTTALNGASGQVYDVTLRFRGVVEEEAYDTADAGDAATPQSGGINAQLFQAGGSPVNTSANVYELAVDNPPQTFFLNSSVSGVPYVVPLDYTVTIPMQGAAHLQLVADPVDGLEYSNIGQDGGAVIPPGVPPAPNAFDGQFVQMDVLSVAAR
jgi:hypothetical protein